VNRVGCASNTDANVAQVRQSRPDSGFGFWAKALKMFKVVPFSPAGAESACSYEKFGPGPLWPTVSGTVGMSASFSVRDPIKR
jgi:hypothetical protein